MITVNGKELTSWRKVVGLIIFIIFAVLVVYGIINIIILASFWLIFTIVFFIIGTVIIILIGDLEG